MLAAQMEGLAAALEQVKVRDAALEQAKVREAAASEQMKVRDERVAELKSQRAKLQGELGFDGQTGYEVGYPQVGDYHFGDPYNTYPIAWHGNPWGP